MIIVEKIDHNREMKDSGRTTLERLISVHQWRNLFLNLESRCLASVAVAIERLTGLWSVPPIGHFCACAGVSDWAHKHICREFCWCQVVPYVNVYTARDICTCSYYAINRYHDPSVTPDHSAKLMTPFRREEHHCRPLTAWSKKVWLEMLTIKPKLILGGLCRKSLQHAPEGKLEEFRYLR